MTPQPAQHGGPSVGWGLVLHVTSYRRLLGYVRPYWGWVGLSILCGLGVSALTGALAWIVKPLQDDLFLDKNRHLLLLLPFGVVILAAVRGGLRYVGSICTGYTGAHVVQDIRDDLYRRMIRFPVPFYAEHSTGALMSRVLNDVSVVQNAAAVVVQELITNAFTVAGLTALMLWMDARLAGWALLILPVSVVPAVLLGRKVRRTSKTVQKEMADLSTHLGDTFSGARTVKSFGTEDVEVERFRDKAKKQLRAALRTVRLAELPSPLMEVIATLGGATILWLGAAEIIRHRVTPGEFFSLLAAMLMMYEPIRALGKVHSQIQKALGAAERVFEFMDVPTEAVLDTGKKEVAEIREGIVFRDAWFTYSRSSAPAIRGVDLEIRRGEVVALCGPSGSGKSTIANLLMRFEDVTRGKVQIDGVDVRDVTLKSLRRMIGIVSQDVFLFSGTVRSNILYGDEGRTEAEMLEAARIAHADVFIRDLVDGYDTVVGERGVRLSGGQKQRIAIARALLRNPPFLILDEATSALDSESETLVHDAISHVMKGRTSLVIAHRLSTIQNADKVVVLDAGRVVQAGRREDLEGQDGLFRRLAATAGSTGIIRTISQ